MTPEYSNFSLTQEYSELCVPLKSVTITKWNVSELVRLCLRKHDADDNLSNADSNESEESLDQEDEVVYFIYKYKTRTRILKWKVLVNFLVAPSRRAERLIYSLWCPDGCMVGCLLTFRTKFRKFHRISKIPK